MADTIAAISTAPGEGGIGIVRVSGPASEGIMRRLMKDCPSGIEARHAYVGKVVRDSSAKDAEVIDEAVFIYMKAPASYTGEDMVELYCHGSVMIAKRIIAACIANGAVYAAQGEFTRRAF